MKLSHDRDLNLCSVTDIRAHSPKPVSTFVFSLTESLALRCDFGWHSVPFGTMSDVSHHVLGAFGDLASR